MEIPIERVVRVSIEGTPRAAVADINMNIVGLITDSNKILNSSERTREYRSLTAVASDFGTNSKEYQYAKIVFAQESNPINKGGGYLVIAYWRARQETINATNGKLTGKSLSESVVVGALQSVTSGGFSISIDSGEVISIHNLNFSTCTSLQEIIDTFKDKITGATVTIDSSNRIIIQSNTKGATSKVSFADNVDGFEEVVSILSLRSGSGAVTTNGEDEKVLEAESKEDALIEILKEEDIKGIVFIDKPSISEAVSLSSFALANDVLIYDVFSSVDNLKVSSENFVWKNILLKGVNYRTLFDKRGDRSLAVAYMSRMHSVNFNGSKTAITMDLKSLSGCEISDFTENELDLAQKVGLDIYGNIKSSPCLYVSGANDFTDTIYHQIAIKKFIQNDIFNELKTTTTKLSQTTNSMIILQSRIEQTLERFVKVDVIAPNEWNSNTTFGNADKFKRDILAVGYFVYFQPLSEQSQADREARKTPLIQVAFKMAGALHSAEIAIVFER